MKPPNPAKSQKRTRPRKCTHWLNDVTRVAIYLRDRHQCVYCAHPPDPESHLTVDHLRSLEAGGSNQPENLVTACMSCNASKQDKTLREWLAFLRKKGIDTEPVLLRVWSARRRRLPRVEARVLVRARKAAKLAAREAAALAESADA